MIKKMIKPLAIALAVLTSNATIAANKFADVNITVTKASGDVYMLQGAGGNIGVLSTDDGLLLVDDQFAPLAERIEQAMKAINPKELKYIVNTHFHGDHTGSNGHFSQQAPIFSHQNVRKRLSAKAGHDHATLPVVTYENGIEIYLNNEEIQLTHLPSGHTDGDTIVYFKNANVLHTGDLFFEVGFPYVDLKHGGSVKGYLSNVRYMLKTFPDNVVIIPGHGKLTDKKALASFADMIEATMNIVAKALAAGKSEQEIITMGLGEQYKDQSWQFISEEKWIKTLVADLK